MTDEQYKKAQELYKQRDYYKNLASEVSWACSTKARKDANAKKSVFSQTQATIALDGRFRNFSE